MTPDILPPWSITQGVGFMWSALVVDDYPAAETPYDDWDQHTAAVRIAADLDSTPFWTGTAICSADGYVTVQIDQSDTAAFATSRRVGGQIAAEAEIIITDPAGAVVMVWQIPVRIARSLAA